MIKRIILAVKEWMDAYEDDVTFLQRTLYEQEKNS
jgi:hypothetical protein